MATAKLELLADSSQIRRADKDLENLGRQGGTTEKATRSLARAFALLGTAISVRQIQQAADAYKSMQNQLRIVTNDTENLLGVTQALNQVAQESRADIDATVGLYSKLARSTSELGLSQGELVRITETINKSFAVSGATAEEANNAITQLAQGLASGALRGDEFNSVAEQAPGILRAVSQETGLAVGELRAFAAEGKITTELLISSLQNYAAQVDTEFSSASVTISQATTQLQNDFIDLIGAFDDATGASGDISDALIGITSAMQTLADYIRADAIRGPFNAQFEGVIGDINSFVNVVGSEFNQFFNGVSAAADETGLRLGDAFFNIVPNIRAAIQIATVEIASFLDTLGAYSAAVAETLNPFDDVSVQQARNNFEDLKDDIRAARKAALTDIVDQNIAEKERTRIAVEESQNRVEQYRKEREARILALGGIENTGGQESPNQQLASEQQFSIFGTEDETNAQYEVFLSLLGTAEQDYEAHQQRMNEIQNAALQARYSAEKSVQTNILGLTSQVFGEIASTIEQAKGKESAAYKVAFLAAKGAAIAQAIIQTELAAVSALAPPPLGLGPVAGAGYAQVIRGLGYASVGIMAGQAIAGFEKGGYTGNYGTKEVAGVVHGQEFVMNARATRANRGALEAMNRGESVGGNTYVNVTNNSSNTEVQTQESTDAQGNRIIDIVFNNINQRGKIHKAMTQTTTASNRI